VKILCIITTDILDQNCLGDKMEHQSELQMNDGNTFWGFLGGLLVGGLTGATAMLLLAPQSGQKTRAKIQQKGIELRQQTSDAVEGAITETRHKAHQMNASAHRQAKAIQQSGQNALDDQKEIFSTFVEGEKAAADHVLS